MAVVWENGARPPPHFAGRVFFGGISLLEMMNFHWHRANEL